MIETRKPTGICQWAFFLSYFLRPPEDLVEFTLSTLCCGVPTFELPFFW